MGVSLPRPRLLFICQKRVSADQTSLHASLVLCPPPAAESHTRSLSSAGDRVRGVGGISGGAGGRTGETRRTIRVRSCRSCDATASR